MSRNRGKKPNAGSLIAVFIALAMFSPDLLAILITIGLFVLPFYLFFRTGKQKKNTGKTRQNTFDDCPKPICFHKDKGEHHVVRGREIDPWDRPDIDISKYQRRE